MTLKPSATQSQFGEQTTQDAHQRPAHSSVQIFSANQMQGGEKLIRLPELLRTIGVSRATAYRYMESGRLPKPMKLSSRCVAWKASAINEWLAHLQAA